MEMAARPNNIRRIKLLVLSVFCCVLAAAFWHNGTLADNNSDQSAKPPSAPAAKVHNITAPADRMTQDRMRWLHEQMVSVLPPLLPEGLSMV